MQLTTPVHIAPSAVRISHATPLVLLGSCFTDEIGRRLQMAGFDCLCNPFGTLYNPLSIAACLSRAINDEEVSREALVHHEGLWHSWFHHGRFSCPDMEGTLRACNESVHVTHRALSRNPVVICTFGTAFAFFLNSSAVSSRLQGMPVANCHKLPSSYFLRKKLSVEEIVDCWNRVLDICPGTFVFTVSPIRHMADGAHGNQLSKSTLLLAVDQLALHDGCYYFDSYEIVMDELRDYRFYARDMCHPSDVAVDVIWERFQQTYMSAETCAVSRQHEKEWRRRQHRPLHG